MQRITTLLRACGVIAAVVAAPRWVCGRAAHEYFDGELAAQRELAKGQQAWIADELAREDFTTGSQHFDGEWLFGSYMMSAMGFGQIALEHPELASELEPWLDRCIERLLAEDVRAFDSRSWDEDALVRAGGEWRVRPGRGHVAYLGYLNLALGMHRRVARDSRWASLNDAITAALVERLGASPRGLVETFPGETYPVDNLAAFGSIGLHARATGRSADTFLQRWAARLRGTQLDRESGLLVQAASARTGAALDAPRGSGTALGAYFASFADPALARDLHAALRRQLMAAPLGLGMVREYPASRSGHGDIDSGPLLFGYSVSATGFSLGSARATGDRAHFGEVFRTADLFGGLRRRGGKRTFVAGGPLGNAIMLAMLSAQAVAS